jgi:hypothetical protein
VLFSAVVGPSNSLEQVKFVDIGAGAHKPALELPPLPAQRPVKRGDLPKGKRARKAAKRMRQTFRAARSVVNPDAGETFRAKPGSRIERETEKFLRYIASRQDPAAKEDHDGRPA